MIMGTLSIALDTKKQNVEDAISIQPTERILLQTHPYRRPRKRSPSAIASTIEHPRSTFTYQE